MTDAILECDEHFKIELFPFAAREIGHPRLTNAKAFGRLGLGEPPLFDTSAQIVDQRGGQFQNSGLDRTAIFGVIKTLGAAVLSPSNFRKQP